jgi:hypothetical protein
MSLQRDNALRVVREQIMGRLQGALIGPQPLTPSPIAAVRLATSTLTGGKRRAFAAEMALQYGAGTPLQAAALFGWSRRTVALGRAASRPGRRCRGAQAAGSGRKRWEATPPAAAAALRRLADAPAQPDPTLRPPLASTRLRAKAARAALRTQGYGAAPRPAPATRAAGLPRLGFGRRTVGQAQPPKKMAATAAMFAHRATKPMTPCQRPTSHAGAALVTPRCPAALGHVAACPAGSRPRGSTPWACPRRTCRVGAWRKRAGSATSPVAGLIRPGSSAGRRLQPGGPPGMRVHRGPWRGASAKWPTARKAAGGGRHFAGAWGRVAMALARRFRYGTLRPLTVHTSRSSGVGASGTGTGTGPRWWMGRRGWHGRRV